jgi:metal-responsive CopG/Arc/MetJ family transcriptional regulator
VQVEIDEKLLKEIRKLADEQGRSEHELLDEAVRLYLERSNPRRFEELLERISSRFDLDEIEAERIAYEELHAMRRERKAAQ